MKFNWYSSFFVKVADGCLQFCQKFVPLWVFWKDFAHICRYLSKFFDIIYNVLQEHLFSKELFSGFFKAFISTKLRYSSPKLGPDNIVFYTCKIFQYLAKAGETVYFIFNRDVFKLFAKTVNNYLVIYFLKRSVSDV